MSSQISVIIPAYNAGPYIEQCLSALAKSTLPPLEVIVVDDGSKDETSAIAREHVSVVLNTGGRCGPALARNLGVRASAGDILFFLDSDVCVQPDTLAKMLKQFEQDPLLDALMGSYDSTPRAGDFLSQYRNLMHSYVHHAGSRRAFSFWSGCGAIRRNVFVKHSGFDESFKAIEDIELGYRLIQGGCRVVLDRDIQVTHLKQWTFWNLVKTDILDRGIPWTELILRDKHMPNDLNLQLSQRVSVALVFILIMLSGIVAVASGGYFLIPLFAILFLMLARWWIEVGSNKRPRSAAVLLIGTVALIVSLAYWRNMMGLIPPLLLTPTLLFARHRYRKQKKLSKWYRRLAIVYICCSVGTALYYVPMHHHLLLVILAVLALIGWMNSQFYIFLAGKRGLPFMLAAIPFHLLFHFYNGVSFIIGIGRHYSRTLRGPLHTASSEEAVTENKT